MNKDGKTGRQARKLSVMMRTWVRGVRVFNTNRYAFKTYTFLMSENSSQWGIFVFCVKII
jgi:hypothetical protein